MRLMVAEAWLLLEKDAASLLAATVARLSSEPTSLEVLVPMMWTEIGAESFSRERPGTRLRVWLPAVVPLRTKSPLRLPPAGIDQTMSLVAPAGKGRDAPAVVLLSVSVTFARSPTPTLPTVTVKPTWLPASTEGLSATFVTATSGAVETWPTMKSERVEFA